MFTVLFSVVYSASFQSVHQLLIIPFLRRQFFLTPTKERSTNITKVLTGKRMTVLRHHLRLSQVAT